MKKKCFTIFLLFTILSYSQEKDTIVQFLNSRGKIVKDISQANYYQTLIKRKDSLFKVSRYRKNGKLFAYWYTQSPDLKDRIGQSVLLNDKKAISSIEYYNSYGKKHGKTQSWFDNGNLNHEGRYINGNKEGLWRFYHENGKIAQQGFYKKDSILKVSYLDENGNKMDKPQKSIDKVFFKGGMKNFHRKIANMPFTIIDKLKGKINLRIMVKADAKIEFLDNEGYIPIEIKSQFIDYLEKIKGFEPRIKNNRKIATMLTVQINFK